MRVMCLDNNYGESLTVGKVYDVITATIKSHNYYYYYITDDSGGLLPIGNWYSHINKTTLPDINWYHKESFIKLDEWRDKQIESLL